MTKLKGILLTQGMHGMISQVEGLAKALDLCNSDFSNAMNDDFNTREALAVLFQFSRLVNGYDLDLLAKSNIWKC